jgi:hypothetical protein
MSITSILGNVVPQRRQQEDVGHRRLLTACVTAAVIGVAALFVYGFDYYLTSSTDRPYHPKHALLRPSGLIGWWLGVFGVVLFFLIFLYALRKKWVWLARLGNSRHWFNFHVLMGVTAPLVIAFHAAFRFRGLAGIAYWIMFAVAGSGIVGRYIYGQIPRSRNAAELSLQESRQLQERLTAKLSAQRIARPADLASLFQLPSAQYVEKQSMLMALCTLLWIDCKRPFHVAKLRRNALGLGSKITTFAGFLSSRNVALENIVDLARQQATISKKLLFLNKSQKVFHLWHVVHRPFSYSFAVLAIIHIVVSVLFGSR